MATIHIEAKNRRRVAILAAARDIIREKGVGALTTRKLAERAGVTAPTLYNLIGSKEQILQAMVQAGVGQTWDRLRFETRDTPLAMLDAIVDEATSVMLEDPDYYRAIFRALDHIPFYFAAPGDLNDTPSDAGERSIEMVKTACNAAIEAGQLRGNLSAGELGQQMFICYRGPTRDWACGLISVEEAVRRIRRGFYLVMAADAEDDLRNELIARASAIKTHRPAKAA